MKKYLTGVALGALAAAGAVYCAGRKEESAIGSSVVTDTVTVRDTIVVHHPLKVATRVIDTIRVAVDSAVDSAVVSLPRQQAVYSDSDYTAWVSGYEPALDSISINMPNRVVTRTVTRTVGRKVSPWSVTLTAGVGVTPRGAEPFVGIGVSYTLFRF